MAPWPPWGLCLLLGVFAALLVRGSGWAPVAAAVLAAVGVVLVHVAQPPPVGGFLDFLAVPAAVAAAVAVGLVLRRVTSRRLSYLLVAVLCALFLVQGVSEARAVEPSISREPQAEGYNYDPVFFLKTFWLVEDHGLGFYGAWGQAAQEDARFSEPTTNLAGWRTPILTRTWSVLFESPRGILWGYVALAVLALVLAYALAARLSDPTRAVVAPAVLVPYYLAALPTLQYLSYEIWGGFFALAAACFVTYRLERAGMALSFGAAIVREWFVAALVGGMTVQLWRRRWYLAALWAVALLLCFLVWGLNLWHARQYLTSVGVHPTLGANERLSAGGPGFLLHTLWYNAQAYGLVHVVPVLVFASGLVGAGVLLLRRRPFVPSLILVPVALFLITGSKASPQGPFTGTDYGGAFLPFVAVASCCLWELFAMRRGKEPLAAPAPLEIRSG